MMIVKNDKEEDYNSWFNLPQERCIYDNETNNYQYLQSVKNKAEDGSDFFNYSFETFGKSIEERRKVD